MKPALRPPIPRRGAAGVALVEVLVSLLIFSIGVVGLVKLQAKASKAAVDSEDRTRAALLAEDLISTMWLKKTSALDADTLTAWENRLKDAKTLGLPGSPAYAVSAAAGVTTVTITWQEPGRVAASDATSAQRSQFQTSVVIEE